MPPVDEPDRPAPPASPGQHLAGEWERALGGDGGARARWQTIEGGGWFWEGDALCVRSGGAEWSGCGWTQCGADTLGRLANLLVQVRVSGRARAAGLSFGPYKDFLAGLEAGPQTRLIQVEVDRGANQWVFRVDGRLTGRSWWDSAVHGVDDLVGGVLTLKACGVEQVRFSGLSVSTFQSSCRLSVVTTCHRFLQRLRISLRNWCHQDLASGAHEVVVVNPASPDGTHEHLAAVAGSYPHVRVRELAVPAELAMNKGALINRGVAASRGEWVWLTDADCLFAPDAASTALGHLAGRTRQLSYGERYFLAAEQTQALLAGRLDGVRDFQDLWRAASRRPPEHHPWGYTQILHRSVLEQVRYREDLNHFAHSDGTFVEQCRRRGIRPAAVPGLFCLHLDHPFAWYGTDSFL